MTLKLDKKDWKILYYLCQDSRKSHNSIAKMIGTSKNVVTYRVNRLMKIGIISGFFTIVDIKPLGAGFYTLLIKVNATKERKKEFIQYLKANNHITIIDEFVGKWNLLVEFACRDLYKLFSFIIDLQNKFSDILNMYEMHPTLEFYRNEQLPVELVETKSIIPKQVKSTPKVLDSTEKRLLLELNRDSKSSLIELAKTIGVTTKTILSKIKKLKMEGIIQKFTARISLGALGYEVYLILFDFNNLSAKFKQKLKGYLHEQKNIRSAFVSAAKQRVFIYLAVKKASELQDFLQAFNNEFQEIIIDQEYLLSSDQIKCELFPEGILE